MPVKAKVESELKNHEAACSQRTNLEEQKKVKQDCWEKTKKTTERFFYACHHCWGKIELDKNISDWNQAKKQALADLAYHEEKECGIEETKKIAIYFSPNQGGNKHADLSYADRIVGERELEKDNQGQVYREQKNINQNRSGNDYTPWLIGGGTILVASLVIAFWKTISSKRKRTKN